MLDVPKVSKIEMVVAMSDNRNCFVIIISLPAGAMELQLLGLSLVVAQRVGPRQHVLQRVFLARHLSLAVELEG